MNIVFYLLVVAAAVFVWFVLAFLFKPLGRFVYRLWSDVEEEIKCEENKDKNN